MLVVMAVVVMVVVDNRFGEMRCPWCGYVWRPRTANPKKCPKCGRWLPGWEARKE
jgi:rubrerythrin